MAVIQNTQGVKPDKRFLGIGGRARLTFPSWQMLVTSKAWQRRYPDLHARLENTPQHPSGDFGGLVWDFVLTGREAWELHGWLSKRTMRKNRNPNKVAAATAAMRELEAAFEVFHPDGDFVIRREDYPPLFADRSPTLSLQLV